MAGCTPAHRVAPAATDEPLCAEGISTTDAVAAVTTVLSAMRFSIDKADPDAGVIRTLPLRAGQFFEPWRRDNVGASGVAEANLHTIRRRVELRVDAQNGRVCIDCAVIVQRLTLPEVPVASVSQTYRMHSRSSSIIQRLELYPGQLRAMDWIDLGDDPLLRAEILERIGHQIDRDKEEEKA
jgi:hypothetical protein